MGSMLRSDKMTFCDMYIQPEAAFEILSKLGTMDCVQFLDLNQELQLFQRNYVTEVCRYAELERKLRYFKSEMEKEKIRVLEPEKEPDAMHPNEMFAFENLFDKWQDDISEMSSNHANLMKNHKELVEMFYVLSTIGPLLGDAESKTESLLGTGNLLKRGQAEALNIGHLTILTGVVRRNRSFPFEMMLWRISRGNIYYRQANKDKIVQDPQTGQDIRKVAFLAICQGEELSNRIHKVCAGFRVNIYPCPMDYNDRMDLINNIDLSIMDLNEVLETTTLERCKALRVIAKQWRAWYIQIRKSKAIYHTMNRFNFDITKKCLIGQCWVPDVELRQVQRNLEKTSKEVGTNVPSFLSRTETTEIPPTYHRTNKFTRGFQALINAYGVSTYRELNPGLYTIVTFPFLFSLMFGDIGHGCLVLVFSIWMISNEKKFLSQRSDNEIWNIFFGGRYITLLLGAFSIFGGIIYNDCFSKGMNLHGSWLNKLKTLPISRHDLAKSSWYDLEPGNNNAYVFGMDPLLMLATNKIMIENSIKMKLSIIIGIVHMLFGLTLSLFNYIYFKKYYLIYFQFIPEILFMTCMFLWLVFMIYFKWFMYNSRVDGVRGSACAPQILILFIDMVLLIETKSTPGCDAYMFTGQGSVQTVLVVMALACIPVMLLGTPLYLLFYHRKKRIEALKLLSNYQRNQNDPNKSEEILLAQLAKHSVSFGDLMIHQGVHTIEFVLSTISHTASYLRLWALSLAHAELSEMLWVMILAQLALADHSTMGVLKLFVIFPVWAVFTVAILVVMEGLSAFLHTLRLHWVEFMSKFYSGEGWLFRPFSFKAIMEAEDDKGESACKDRSDKI